LGSLVFFAMNIGAQDADELSEEFLEFLGEWETTEGISFFPDEIAEIEIQQEGPVKVANDEQE